MLPDFQYFLVVNRQNSSFPARIALAPTYTPGTNLALSTSANHALQYAIIVSCGVEVLAPSRSSQTLTPSGKPICCTCLAAFFPFLVPSVCDGDQFSGATC